MRVGVYMGSFDPVHKGHIRIVRHLLKKGYVDQVLIVPTGNYWEKQSLTDVKKRIRMLKLFENEKIRIEEEFNELPYTYQLLRAVKKRDPGNEYYVIMGADTLLRFEDWNHYREVLEYPFLVLKRERIDAKKKLEELHKENYVLVEDLKEIDISSTYIRQNLDDYSKIKNMIHRRVYDIYTE